MTADAKAGAGQYDNERIELRIKNFWQQHFEKFAENIEKVLYNN